MLSGAAATCALAVAVVAYYVADAVAADGSLVHDFGHREYPWSVQSSDRQSSEGVRRILLLALMDVAVATVVAVFVFRTFGAVSGVDTNPPECYNSSGRVVSCSLTPPVLMIPTFGVVLLGLAAWQRGRRRKARA